MKRLFISTTNTVENSKIIEYYGVVSSHIVAGTGFLTDFAASFSDLFGGRSKSYKWQLERIYDEALKELSEKASSRGANGIIGLKIDIDNISGKGMSMFMITAVGTAVKIVFGLNTQKSSPLENTITNDTLNAEVTKRAILSQLYKEDKPLSEAIWSAILNQPENDYAQPLTKLLFNYVTNKYSFNSDYDNVFKKKYSDFIQLIDRRLVLQGIEENLQMENGYSAACSIMNYFSLFDAKILLTLVQEGFYKQVIPILDIEQPSYTEDDLHYMVALADSFDNLPNIGKIEVVKGGVFSKDDEKYICPHGHKNNPDVEFCNVCHENIKGLSQDDIKAINVFKCRVSVLKDLLAG